MKTSCIAYPPRDVFLKLHRSLCQVCDDDPIEAALLQFLVGWHNSCLDHEEQRVKVLRRMQRRGAPLPNDCGLWHAHDMEDFEEALLGLAKEDSIRVKLHRLCQRAFIAMGPHPVKRCRWDRTLWFRVYPGEVQKALDRLTSPDPALPACDSPESRDTPQTHVAVQTRRTVDADPKNPDSSPEESGVNQKILDLFLDLYRFPLPKAPPQVEQGTENDTGNPAPPPLAVGAAEEPTTDEGEAATPVDEPTAETTPASPAGASLSATPQPTAAEAQATTEPPAPSDTVQPLGGDAATPPATRQQPTTRPRGCEHLPVPANDLHAQWLARFPDEALRDAWFQVGRRRLRCKKGWSVINDCTPSIISEAIAAYEEFLQELARQGRHVNGGPVWPPQRE